MHADIPTVAAAARTEIAEYAYPGHSWTTPPETTAGVRGVDVLVIGAGQLGIALAARLTRSGVRSVEVVDAAPRGGEGPWATWGRMETLRSAKNLHGPEAGVHAAGIRSWFDAVHGDGAFDEIDLIPRLDWASYLLWLRDVLGVAVANDTRVVSAVPEEEAWLVTLETPRGIERVLARKVVAATGIDGAGGPRIPAVLTGLPADRLVHSSASLASDFFAGKRVAVIGLGASAFDNAAVAAETGATEVVHFGRRATLPTLNAYRFLEKEGLFHAYGSLSDDVRIGFARAEMSVPMPPPPHSVERCARQQAYRLELGVSISRAENTPSGVVLFDGDLSWEVDVVVAGTGFDVNLAQVDWLAAVADDIALWRDRAELGVDAVDALIGAHPYLSGGMACTPRTPASPRALRNLHLANVASHISFGITTAGVNGLPWAVSNVHDQIVRDLTVADSRSLLTDFRAFLSADAPLPTPAGARA